MPKFARSNVYNGRQSNQAKTGATRAANETEAVAGLSEQLYISPATLGEAVSNLTQNLEIESLGIEGGAVTDNIGTGTLVAGVATILNTDIAATDRVFIQRISGGASTALGVLSYTINAGTSLVVTSLAADNTTETDDVSTFSYVIINQL